MIRRSGRIKEKVELKRISLTGFRNCTSRSYYRSVSKQTTRKRRAFWSLNEDILKITILKTNTPYPSRKIQRIRACTYQRPQRNKDQYAVSRGLNTPYSRYGINIIFWKISSVVPTLRNPQYAVSNTWIRLRMTKVIKEEFEKIMDVKVEDVSLTCDTQLKIFNMEVSRLSRMDDDLFTYEVEVANIPCNSKKNDDSEDDDDDLGGDDEVELTDGESSDDMNEVAEVFWIDTNLFDFETPMYKAFNEFNYLLQIDPYLLTKDIKGFKTYEDNKNDWIYEWNKDVPWVDEKPWTNTRVWTKPTPVKHTGCSEWPTCSWKDDGYYNGGNLPRTYIIENQLHYQDYKWYEALEDSELKDLALRNKAIMEGFINEDDDESRYKIGNTTCLSIFLHDIWRKEIWNIGEEIYISGKS
ncbi:hypothetical protein Tco_1315674 [Tanacetum coccineum]